MNSQLVIFFTHAGEQDAKQIKRFRPGVSRISSNAHGGFYRLRGRVDLLLGPGESLFVPAVRPDRTAVLKQSDFI